MSHKAHAHPLVLGEGKVCHMKESERLIRMGEKARRELHRALEDQRRSLRKFDDDSLLDEDALCDREALMRSDHEHFGCMGGMEGMIFI